MPAKEFVAFTRLYASDVNAYLANRPLQNAIINGAFEINQRDFTTSTTNATYGFDRFRQFNADGTVTYSAQTFTLGAAPVSGYESANFARIVTTGQTLDSANARLVQDIESVRTFAGETVTVSFFAKAASGTPKISVELGQEFGTGGSPSSAVNTNAGSVTIGTSWQRYSVTVAIPSISGKTLGTGKNDFLRLALWLSAGSNFNARTGSLGIQSNTFDIWGVQVEAGTVANDFRRNANSIQGELAACQRYYLRHNATSANAFERVGLGSASSTTGASILIPIPVQFRTNPSSIEFSGLSLFDGTAFTAVTGATLDNAGVKIVVVVATVASGLTQFRPYQLGANNNANMFLGINAEL
jgi:hypothetical protein